MPVKKSNYNSPACSSWQPPHPCQKAVCPCNALDREDSGILDQCWRSAVSHSLCSKHQTPCHTGKEISQIVTWMKSSVKVWFMQKTNKNFHLINVFTMGTISTKASRTWAALPGSIWRAAAIHSAKAWVRQTSICKGLRWQGWIQIMKIDLDML